MNLLKIWNNRRKLFKDKDIIINEFYVDLPAGERIRKTIEDFLKPTLEDNGFKLHKTDLQFNKSNDFFDFDIYFKKDRRNSRDSRVAFDILLSVFSKKYRKWEKYTYEWQFAPENSINGKSVDYIDNWDKKYYDCSWYDLKRYDNDKIMKAIIDNLLDAGMQFFNQFSTIESSIDYLKKNPQRHFEKIIDFYLLLGKPELAFEFHEEIKGWIEEQIESKDNHFISNRLKIYELRKEKIINWAQHHSKKIERHV
jgi:hypothetical protein